MSSKLAALDNIYEKTYLHISGTDGRIPGHRHRRLPRVCACVHVCVLLARIVSTPFLIGEISQFSRH